MAYKIYINLHVSNDYGFMYGQAFEDLDGHIWEPFWMDVSQMPKK